LWLLMSNVLRRRVTRRCPSQRPARASVGLVSQLTASARGDAAVREGGLVVGSMQPSWYLLKMSSYLKEKKSRTAARMINPRTSHRAQLSHVLS
jgi:hypothetical protein